MKWLLRLTGTEFKGDYIHRSILVPSDLNSLDHGPLEGAGLFTDEEVDTVLLADAANIEALQPHPAHAEDTMADFLQRLEKDRKEYTSAGALMAGGRFLSSLDFALRVKYFLDDTHQPSNEDFEEARRRLNEQW